MTAFPSRDYTALPRLKGSNSSNKPVGSALLTVKSPSLILQTILIIVLNIRKSPGDAPFFLTRNVRSCRDALRVWPIDRESQGQGPGIEMQTMQTHRDHTVQRY